LEKTAAAQKAAAFIDIISFLATFLPENSGHRAGYSINSSARLTN
jgi:hypothetical protein